MSRTIENGEYLPQVERDIITNEVRGATLLRSKLLLEALESEKMQTNLSLRPKLQMELIRVARQYVPRKGAIMQWPNGLMRVIGYLAGERALASAEVAAVHACIRAALPPHLRSELDDHAQLQLLWQAGTSAEVTSTGSALDSVRRTILPEIDFEVLIREIAAARFDLVGLTKPLKKYRDDLAKTQKGSE